MSDELDRPENIHCIRQTHAEKKDLSWCGRNLKQAMEWHFINIDHAVYTTLARDRLLPCWECIRVITKALEGEISREEFFDG